MPPDCLICTAGTNQLLNSSIPGKAGIGKSGYSGPVLNMPSFPVTVKEKEEEKVQEEKT